MVIKMKIMIAGVGKLGQYLARELASDGNEVTIVDYKPFDNKEVMSLFQDTHALQVSPKDIGDCPLGSQGIPEFGTEFVIQMLIDTKPQTFSDLIRISGLSAGQSLAIETNPIFLPAMIRHFCMNKPDSADMLPDVI